MGNVLKATKAGDRRRQLEAMAERVADAIDSEDTPARDLGTLTRRHMEICRELDTLRVKDGPGGVIVNTADERWSA